MLLSSPGSSAQLVHVHLLQFFWLHLFPNTYETILGHFGERTVLPKAAGLKMKSVRLSHCEHSGSGKRHAKGSSWSLISHLINSTELLEEGLCRSQKRGAVGTQH